MQRFPARLRSAALGCSFALLTSACSGGGGLTVPSQSVSQNGAGSSLGQNGSAPAAPAAPSTPSATGAPTAPASGSSAVVQASPQASNDIFVSAQSRTLSGVATPPIPSGGTQVFSDNFSGDPIGAAPAGWIVESGVWSVCQVPGAHEACSRSASGGYALTGSSLWRDYYVDAVAVDSNFAQGGVAILGRAQDATHFYQLELRRDYHGSNQTMWYIWKYDGSRWMELAGGAFITHSNPDYRLRMSFTGDRISAYVAYDDTQNFQALGSGSDSSYVSGKIGMRSWATGAARFGAVVVTLAAAATAPPSPTVAPPAPTIAPPAPAPAPPGNVASYHGCSIFTPGDYYNADITGAAVDPHSADYIASVTATDNTGFYASTGIEQVNIATSNTPKYAVQKVNGHQYTYEFASPEPWSSNFYIEPGNGDSHAMVLLVTPPACHLYESYETSFTNNTLYGYSGAQYDLSKPFVLGPAHHPTAMASGLSIFAGMVKHDEIATGIHHALNFSMFAGAPCNCYTAPANNTDGLRYNGPSAQYQFPYGGHLRLKASFDDSHFGPQARAIAEAMKHYGIFLADTGGHYSNNNAIYMANPTDGGTWIGSDLGALGTLRFTDFDVLRVGQTTSN